MMRELCLPKIVIVRDLFRWMPLSSEIIGEIFFKACFQESSF